MRVASGEQCGRGERKSLRKAHKKSRNGCVNCKIRKIKCDERKPRCSHCIHHEDTCGFETAASVSGGIHSRLSTPSQANSSISGDTPKPIPDPIQLSASSEGHLPALNISDLELLHNYDTLTAHTLSDIPALQVFFKFNIPQFAFSHPFLLHAVLALSALHLSHFRTGDSRSLYSSQANHHYEIALRTASSLLPDINPETAPPLYLFATICCVFTLGTSPQPGDFLLFSEQGIAKWIVLFRGINSIFTSNHDVLYKSKISPLFNISARYLHQVGSKEEHLLELQRLILDTTLNHPNRPIYCAALETFIGLSPGSPVPGMRVHLSSPHIAFACLYRFSEEFVLCLQQRDQIALVILAYFCVMLHDVSSFWWVKGWAEHLISEVHASLSEEYRLWIRWPLEEIGWVPE